MSSLLATKPGMRFLFFNQKIEQKDPEKKIPSTAAKATSLSPKLFSSLIHFNAQSAFFLTQGTSSIALNNFFLSGPFLIYVSISSEYVSACIFSIAI
jgi:hypothetical protein